MAGDEVTGVSIMRVTAGLDSGPVCAQARCAVEPEDSYGSLAAKLAPVGGELMVSSLDQPLQFAEQDEALATYADKITAEDRWLDPGQPAEELARRVRALSPHIGARVELPEGGELGVLAARVVEGPSGQAGSLAAVGRQPVLICGGGGLELLEVKPPGRGAMSGEDWLRGHRL
jgi:methionyl-tRNA formyltransferase